MLHTIILLAKKLISIKSTSENRNVLEEVLEFALSNVRGHAIERFERNGVKSGLVYNLHKRPKEFGVILNGHLDVIPGKEYQYKPYVRGRRLYGVGAMDMKASVACLILAFKEVASKVDYPLGLQLVTDEEVGGFDGTKYQIDKGVKANFVIVGESTNLHIENKAKGVLWVKISTRGKTAHGAYPWKGENAAWKMNDFLKRLKKRYPVLKQEKWITTINLANIETQNKTFNKIPDRCEVWLDIRYVPEEADTIVSDLKKLLPDGFTFEVVVKEPALSTNENNHFLQSLKMETEQITRKKGYVLCGNGSSDARHFMRVNCPAIEFGPIGGGMGSDKEWVDIPSLGKYYQILRNFLLSF